MPAWAQGALPATVPRLVNYQGTIVDSNGDPMPNGDYDFVCSVWDKEAAGEGLELWGPQTFTGVAVVNGYFSIVLGPMDDDAPPRPIRRAFQETSGAEPDRYLEIKVMQDAQMLTLDRQEVLTSAYAMRAENDVPPGTIIMFAGPDGNVPEGWFPCDGRGLSSTEYPSLFGAIGTLWGAGGGASDFNVPDLRDQYLRGVDAGAGRDPDAASRTPAGTGDPEGVGSLQDSSLHDHTHGMGSHVHSGGSLYGHFAFDNANAYSTTSRFGLILPWTSSHEFGSISYFTASGSRTDALDIGGSTGEPSIGTTSGTTPDPGASAETRPVSRVTLFIIKY
jgi:microcystin-dependent protein